MHGVVFKLSAKGSNNANDRLTMLVSKSVIRPTYVDVYDHTLRVFPALVTELSMHPIIHETSLGATAGFRHFMKEFPPEAVPRDVEAEGEQPYVAAPVLLVAAEDISAAPEVAFACVWLRTDVEGETEPEASEPIAAIPLSTNIPA